MTFVDPARNRTIPTELYYPASTPGHNVPVAQPPGDGFPAITFGHGYLMVWSAYANIWQALVPRGYVVAFPRTEEGLLPSHLELARDLVFLVARLRQENENASSPFFGALAEEAAVMGHSMGGGASVLAAALDTTITALANMAAAETNPSAIQAASNVGQPALVISGSLDGVTPPAEHQIPIYQALASTCKTYVSITGGSHCQFAMYNLNCSLGEAFAPPPTIDRPTQHALTAGFLLPWLDAHLKGQEEEWFVFEDLLVSCAGVTFQHDCDALPPAPPVIVGVSTDPPTVTVRWLPSPFASAYRVYSSPLPFPPPTAGEVVATTTDTSWVGTSQEPSRFFWVTAIKGSP